MYGYIGDFIPLNEEEILKRISQEEIIEMVLGYKPILYQWIKSPIRRDNKPGARFENWRGKLFFIDFADNPTHRVAIRFVADYYNITWFETLKIINKHFELGLGDHNEDDILEPKPIVYNQIEQAHYKGQDKERVVITYRPRPLDLRDKGYWNPYQITKAQLMEDDVYAVVWYKFYSFNKKQWIVLRPRDICYAYTEWHERIKIYRPFFEKQRFTTNCSENDIGNLKNLPISGRDLIITKSYKDCRVLRNQGLITIWLQNEGCVPDQAILIDLCERFDNIWIWFDNDDPGIQAAFKITNIINKLYPDKALPIYLPQSLLAFHIKDPSDLTKKSENDLKQFINEKRWQTFP